MANLKINNLAEISGSTRNLDWIRSCCEYLMERDKSLNIDAVILEIGTRYSVAGGWTQTEIRVTGSSTTPNSRIYRAGNRIRIGPGVKSIIVFSSLMAWQANTTSEFDTSFKCSRNGSYVFDVGSFGRIEEGGVNCNNMVKLLQGLQEGDDISIWTNSGASYEMLNWSNVVAIVVETDASPKSSIPEENTMLRLIEALENYKEPYPVGSIYMSVNNVDPSTLFGGTWQKIEDRMLLGSGSRYTLGATGGKADTLRSIFGITGTAYGGLSGGSGGGSYNARIATVDGAHANTDSSMRAFSNVPDMDFMSPYLVVNIWYRVS